MEQRETVEFSQDASPNLGSLRPIVAQRAARYDVANKVQRCIIKPGEFLSTLPTYIPPQWSDFVHPEGKTYFYQNSELHVMKDSYLYNPVTAEKISGLANEAQEIQLTKPLISHGTAIPQHEGGNLNADDNPRNVHMFSNSQNISIRDTAIHNVGGDMTIIHNHNTYHDSEPSPSNVLSKWSNLFSSAKSHIFHAVEIIKSVLPSGFVTTPEMYLDEKVASDALKYPPLNSSNAQILLSKTSMCIPGFASQILSSVRYSFFS